MIKGNPRGLFDDNTQRKRKLDKKAKAQAEREADSELLVDIDKRLKTLIDKNRTVTKSYMDKAKAFEDDREKLQRSTEKICSDTKDTTEARDRTLMTGTDENQPKDKESGKSQLLIDDEKSLVHAGSLLDNEIVSEDSHKAENVAY